MSAHSTRHRVPRRTPEAEALALADSLFDSAAIGLAYVDRDQRIQRVNRLLASMNGGTVERYVGRTLREAMPQIAERLEDVNRKVVATGEPVRDVTLRAEAPAWPGEARDYVASCLPVRGTDGAVLGVLSMLQDVTETRLGEGALRRSEAQFRAMCDASPLGILLTALDGTTIYANQVLLRQMGLSAAQVAEFGWRDAIHPDDRDRVYDYFAKCQTAGTLFDTEHRYLHADGTVVWIRARASTVRDGGTSIGYIALVEDITDMKRLETERLHSQKLESVGRLAGGVAHDFNNLLTVILSHAEFVGLALPPEHEAQADVRQIREAGDRAALLTRQLLSFARRQIIQPRAFDLNATTRDTERMLHRLIGEDIEIQLHLQPELWLVESDPSQIGQVLINLAVNARDAMPSGGRLRIETRNCTLDASKAQRYPGLPAGDYVKLIVRDTGTGMSPEVRERVFEPFYTTKERGKGTGLGLATCYGIIRQSGGYIGVTSEPGKGSTFVVLLPRARATAPEATEPLAPDLARGTGTVLLVEDEDMVREMSGRALQDCGYTVYLAANASEAIPMASALQARLDLLITDVIMPEMSGPELAGQVKRMAPQIECLFISGYAEESIAHHGVLEEGVAFLQKPFVPSTLAERVRELLDTRAARRGPGS